MKKKICFIILFMLAIVILNIPSFAIFEIDDFTIDAEVSPEGDMKVVETITYFSNEEVNGVTRNIEAVNSSNSTNSADGLTLMSVKADGMLYQLTDYAVKGESGVYTYTNTNNSINLTVYTPFTSDTKIVEYTYLLKNVAVKYNDTAEIFWNFIGTEWDCRINSLTINIDLPSMAANDTIWVYGHGSDNGTFDKTGNHITLNVQSIPAYNSIDARILFSRDAISDSTKTVSKSVLSDYIKTEEGMYKELEAKKFMFGLTINEVALYLGILILIVAICVYIFFDKEVKVEKSHYFREMPYNLEPEILQYFYYGKVVSNSFYIAVLNLVKLGVYNIENTVNEVGKETQTLIYNSEHNAQLKEYQKNMVVTINGFLDEDKNGRKSQDMVRLASKMSHSTGSGYRKFQDGLKEEKEALVGKPTKIPSKIIGSIIFVAIAVIAFIVLITSVVAGAENAFGLAMFLAITTIVYSLFFATVGNFLPALVFVIFHASCFQIGIIAMMKEFGVIAFYPIYLMVFALIQYVIRVKKYPKEERQIIEYIKGLKRYIKHYSMLSEKEGVVENIALWEDYFIMAIALGLNSKTINYFYNYGKEQNSNLGMSMRYTHSYSHFHHDMYNSFYNYQKSYTSTHSSSGGYSSSSGSSHSGSHGGFSGGHSSGGHGGGGGGGSHF